jgi:hypothetical protein
MRHQKIRRFVELWVLHIYMNRNETPEQFEAEIALGCNDPK